MKKIVVGFGSVLAIILIISLWWRYTYCREIPIFESKKGEYEITSIYYKGKSIDIDKVDIDTIDKLLYDAKGTRTYYCYYPYSVKEYILDIDYRKELKDLVSIHCGKEGMFFSIGTDSNKTYSVVNGEKIAEELLEILESVSEDDNK